MKQQQHVVTLRSEGVGLHEITAELESLVRASGLRTGMCHVFVRHTSASLLIQENADPSARRDIERWFERLTPEDDPLYSHTSEGPDDMPSHIRSALTSVSELIPIINGRLGLGTWQGLYLFEHRRRKTRREIVVSLWGEE